MTTYFLFDGGNYKYDVDDGRIRQPLTDFEAQMLFYDPEIPGDTDNSLGTTLPMAKYASELCNLEVDDEIMVGLVPDATIIRGLWMGSFDTVEGFEVAVDLVPIRAIYEQYLSDQNGGSTPSQISLIGTNPMNYSFDNGLGNATKDAYQLAKLWGGTLSDYRNDNALQVNMFRNPVFAGLGMACYIRLKIVSLGEYGENADEEGCCSTCNNAKYPTFQVGVIYDRICFDKQRVRNYCNCNDSACATGCNTDSDEVRAYPYPKFLGGW